MKEVCFVCGMSLYMVPKTISRNRDMHIHHMTYRDDRLPCLDRTKDDLVFLFSSFFGIACLMFVRS